MKRLRENRKVSELEEIIQKIFVKEGRLNRCQDKIKQYNNERPFYKQVGGECTRMNQQPDAIESKQFLSKIWERNQHNRKSEWIDSMKRESQGLEDNPKVD